MTGLNGSIFSSDHQAVVLEFHCHPAEDMTTGNRSGVSEVPWARRIVDIFGKSEFILRMPQKYDFQLSNFEFGDFVKF